jgi:hypothetical protein
VITIVLLALLFFVGGSLSANSTVGSWSAPVDVGVVGIHAVLLRTGKVLLFGHSDDTHSSEACVLDPVTGIITDVTFTKSPPINFFCSAHNQLPDGTILIAGGQIHGDYADSMYKGTDEATLFNPAKNSWTRLPRMSHARWYPTNTALSDGTTLVATGFEADGVTIVQQMEVYDPVTRLFSALSSSADNDTALYAQMSLLPSGQVFRSEPDQAGELYDPISQTWTYVDDMNHGYRKYAGTVLLPGLTRVLVSGGREAFDGADPATETAEVIDLTAPVPQWQYTGALNVARWNHNLVLLPDETVLAIGGGQGPGLYESPVFSAEQYDPITGQWSLMASQEVQRTYHSTALLLPDGRVLSAGSDSGPQSKTVEYYSPQYLFMGARPKINSAPSNLFYGASVKVATPDAASVERVSLIRLGSTTHTNDFDQRLVRLSFTKKSTALMVSAPTSRAVAPPGYYMLFLVNGAGVPSVAPILRLR